MGNAHSTSSPSESRTISRKYSAGISRLGGSCCYAWDSHTSSAVSDESVYNEKSNLDHSLPKHAPKSVDKDAAVAYKAFLKAFPEYGLTSTLDNLRASDFSRLDRAGETYVDYMGGAVYPESLIRRNTAFLNNNVLGNTHSVSNRWGISAFEYFSPCSLIILAARRYLRRVQIRHAPLFFLSSKHLRNTPSYSRATLLVP